MKSLTIELHEIYNKKAENAMFRLRTNVYESGEKAGKLLVRQLKQKYASFVIPAIKHGSGEVLTGTKYCIITMCFVTFIQLFVCLTVT